LMTSASRPAPSGYMTSPCNKEYIDHIQEGSLHKHPQQTHLIVDKNQIHMQRRQPVTTTTVLPHPRYTSTDAPIFAYWRYLSQPSISHGSKANKENENKKCVAKVGDSEDDPRIYREMQR
jgi:hypothetical protein